MLGTLKKSVHWCSVLFPDLRGPLRIRLRMGRLTAVALCLSVAAAGDTIHRVHAQSYHNTWAGIRGVSGAIASLLDCNMVPLMNKWSNVAIMCVRAGGVHIGKTWVGLDLSERVRGSPMVN